jgi:ribosome-associated toxin RatA of RatAB toxin-antitoxin module
VTSIDVRRTAEGYVVDLVMRAPAPPELAFEVLVDFEHRASFVPSLSESRIVRRQTNKLTVEQQGVARFGYLRLPFTTVREIEFSAPDAIHSTQIKGSMERLESHMKLAAEGTGTRLDHHIEMTPGIVAAAVLSRSFLEHEFGEQFDAIIAEMVCRKGGIAAAR